MFNTLTTPETWRDCRDCDTRDNRAPDLSLVASLSRVFGMPREQYGMTVVQSRGMFDILIVRRASSINTLNDMIESHLWVGHFRHRKSPKRTRVYFSSMKSSKHQDRSVRCQGHSLSRVRRIGRLHSAKNLEIPQPRQVIHLQTSQWPVKSKNSSQHNQAKKAHKNGQTDENDRLTTTQTGTDPKFRRNHRHALHGTMRALKEVKEGKRESA
ncbi:hypothetical protein KCU61_g812, partial [Aureobasidium melanogenum]